MQDLTVLQERLEGIDPNDLHSLERWYDSAVEAIEGIFASTAAEAYFSSNCGFDFGYVMGGERSFYGANTRRAKGILNRIVSELRTEVVAEESPSTLPTRSDDIFIVHGHEDAVREAVARVVSKFGLNPLILHEQPNQGATIIEKFERSAKVGFAIILLTGDDEGCAKGTGNLSERARQNVILEMGYFIGKLGRRNVMVLRKGDVELPSDILGVVYEPFDDGGAWQLKLGKELRAAGYEVDLKKL